MSNVTNNENMRRYVHMSLSNKSSNSGSGDGSGSSFPGVIIVTGHFDEYNAFSPGEGQPTINEVYDLFRAGGTVVLHQSSEEGEAYYRAGFAFSGKVKGGRTVISICTDVKEIENAPYWAETQGGDGGGGILA